MTSPSLPLAGVRVIDMSRVLAGPYCGLILSFLGAEVIKVEDQRGDETRAWPPFTKDMSDSFQAVNLNKKGIAVDLKTAEGPQIVRDLVRGADVLVENFKTGDMEKFGLGYESLKEINPGLVFTSIAAFGRRGPLADRPGYETLLQAYSGIMSFTGMPGGEPVRSGVSFLDLSSGIFAALATVTALFRRKDTGEGALVEGSLLQSAIFMMSVQMGCFLQSGVMPQKLGSGHASAAPYQAFPTADGHALIAAANQNLWEKLARALELEWMIGEEKFKDNAGRIANLAEFIGLLSDVTRKWKTNDLAAHLVAAGVPCAPINDLAGLMADGQAEALGAIGELDDPEYGRLRYATPGFHMTGFTGGATFRAPKLGEHTREVLHGLGYDDARVQALIDNKVVAAL